MVGLCTSRMATSLRPKEPPPAALVTLSHYLVRNYEGGESTVETVAAGDLVGCYPYCLDGDAAPVTIRADKSSTVYVVDGADLNEHYRQSQAAERMGRDYMAYRLEQVKSQIYSHYCEKGVRDV